jgi:hypothetical protein
MDYRIRLILSLELPLTRLDMPTLIEAMCSALPYGCAPVVEESTLLPAIEDLDETRIEESRFTVREVFVRGPNPNANPNPLFGEDSPQAKLTEECVIEIRNRMDVTDREFGDRFNVHPSTIWQARWGYTWRHLPFPQDVVSHRNYYKNKLVEV